MRPLTAALAAALLLSPVAGCARPALGTPQTPAAPSRLVEDRALSDLSGDIASGRLSSEQAVLAYLSRIEALDRSGPLLNSVISINPNAQAEARALDEERRKSGPRGPLHGVPVLIKDNIETRELPTTAGSPALAQNFTGRDAPIVARLRAQGAVILGKTNLSEWANIRSSRSISGWSGVGGQTRNPYALDRNPCGSSSGSGTAAAASLAAATIGTETDGSITCPAAVSGLVGFKPTVGLVSRSLVIPISSTQDTPGPMTRTVRDAAILLDAIAGTDPADPATAEADARKVPYPALLDANALRGKRVGVMRFAAGFHPETDAVFDQALKDLEAAGAELVEVPAPKGLGEIGRHELVVLLAEFKHELNAYLAGTPPTVRTRTLAEVIAFNQADPNQLALFGQELFEQAQKTKGLKDPEYLKARETAVRLSGAEGIDKLLADHDLDLLVAPTLGPAWPIDPVLKDRYVGGGGGRMAAVAGYPHLTVPMGQVRGLPVGLSFFGPKWSDAEVLSAGYAYEQRTRRRTPPTFRRTVDDAVAPFAR